MNPAIALPPARRLTDLLSSGSDAGVKSKRNAMDQPRTDEDQQLVARTQEGDASAFDQLVVKYTPRLYGLVYNMTSNHEDTNDLLQDIFAKAYKAIRGFRGKSSFYTWIHSIAVNMTLNFLKKRGRRFQLSLDDVDASVQNDKEFLELTATSSPVREADLSELQRRLNEAMMKLSDEHRAVVTMFHIQGMPHAEISKILRVSEGTVRSRLFYANRQLQNYLDEFRKFLARISSSSARRTIAATALANLRRSGARFWPLSQPLNSYFLSGRGHRCAHVRGSNFPADLPGATAGHGCRQRSPSVGCACQL